MGLFAKLKDALLGGDHGLSKEFVAEYVEKIDALTAQYKGFASINASAEQAARNMIDQALENGTLAELEHTEGRELGGGRTMRDMIIDQEIQFFKICYGDPPETETHERQRAP